ncbi:MAG: phosphatase PAP2 family protein [Desulfuromonadaceae bacterium]|nr:phosphatase PAP2 family protein [Desulfuromonadaceae bacterium]
MISLDIRVPAFLCAQLAKGASEKQLNKTGKRIFGGNLSHKILSTTATLLTKHNNRIVTIIILAYSIIFSFSAFAEPLNSSIVEQTTVIPAVTINLQPKPGDLTTSDDKISLEYAKGIFTDAGKILVSPLKWDVSDWLKAATVVGVTGGIYLLDGDIRNYAQNHQSSVANKFASVGNDLGNPLYTLPPVGAFYLYGYLADDTKARKTSLLAIESLAISSLFTEVLKVTTQRARPNTGASPNTWKGPRLSLKNLSFCSGHTSSAFSIATVFAEEYKEIWFVPPIAYTLAALTGLSRVYGNEHWASDVFFGAALGYFVGQTVVKFHKNNTAHNISIVPMVSSDYKGLAVSYKF